MATNQEKRKEAASSPLWGEQVEEDVDIIERDKAFKTPDKLKRTPVTSHVISNANTQAAPRKPSSSKTATEQAHCFNAHAHDHTLSPTKTGSSKNSPMTVLLKTAMDMVKRAKNKLKTQNTTGEPKRVKEAVLADFDDIVEFIEAIHEVENRLSSLENGMANVEDGIKELTQTIKETPRTSYAQAAHNAGTHNGSPNRNSHSGNSTDHKAKPTNRRASLEKNQQEQAQRKMDQAKYQVTLNTAGAPRTTQTIITSDTHQEITEKCQQAIKKAIPEAPTPIIRGVQVLGESKDIRFTCDTQEEAQRLREIDWTVAYAGLTARKPKYGIVIHGLATSEIAPNDITEQLIKEIEAQNDDKQLKIVNLRTLRPTEKLDPAANSNSFVIQTHDARAANKCLRQGIHINYHQYPTEKHTPQYQITQCFNCQEYGHRAAQCLGKLTCAKCSHGHKTKECPNDIDTVTKCANCGEDHAAWSHECEHRIAESERLDELRQLAKDVYFNE